MICYCILMIETVTSRVLVEVEEVGIVGKGLGTIG